MAFSGLFLNSLLWPLRLSHLLFWHLSTLCRLFPGERARWLARKGKKNDELSAAFVVANNVK